MAVSKRTRYEVLRRCNFACYYCGFPAPIVRLEVDHVVPRALGGTDHGSNLIAACSACNSGKRDSVPPPEFVERVRREYCATVQAFDRHTAPAACDVCGQVVQFDRSDLENARCDRCAREWRDAFESGYRIGRKHTLEGLVV